MLMLPNLSKTAPVSWLQRDYTDIFAGLALGAIAAATAYWGAQQIGPSILDIALYGDTWFDSDVAAYYVTLSDPQNPILHERTYKHPLLSLVFCLPVYGLQWLHVPAVLSVKIFVSAVAALWIGSLFCALRSMGCWRLESILLSLLGITSAAGLCWLTILESFPIGSVGMIWAIALVALSDSRRLPQRWGIVVGIATLSITITNWLVGLVATFLAYGQKRSMREFVRVNGLACAIVIALAALQRLLFNFEIPPMILKTDLKKYIVSEAAGGPWNVIQSFVCHTLVMPAIQVIEHPRKELPIMTMQFSAPGTGSAMGAIAVGLWLGLVALGLWHLFKLKTHRRLRLMLGISLLGQLCLHLIYTGRETFLYSLHFLPFWIGLAALAALGTHRRLLIALLLALLLTMGSNNFTQFAQASAFYQSPAPMELHSSHLNLGNNPSIEIP
jgi:hypothetical protein